MARTIEELLSRYFRRSATEEYTLRSDPGVPIDAAEAARLSADLSIRQRAAIDADTLAALTDLLREIPTVAKWDFLYDIKDLSRMAWFTGLRSPDRERSWTTLTVIYGFFARLGPTVTYHHSNKPAWWCIQNVIAFMSQRAMKLDAEQAFVTIESSVREHMGTRSFDYLPLGPAMTAILRLKDKLKPTPADADLLALVRAQLEEDGYSAESRTWKNAIDELLSDASGQPADLLWPGEPWAKAINESVRALGDPHRDRALRLLKHAATVSEFSKPSKAWVKDAQAIVDEIGPAEAPAMLGAWFKEFAMGERAALAASEHQRLHGDYGLGDQNDGRYRTNTAYMVGLAHAARCCCGGAKLLPVLCDVIERIAKAPHAVREHAINVAKAALRTIEASDHPISVAMLSRLSLRVRWPKLRKAIEKAYEGRLSRGGMSRDEADEAGVPDFGIVGGVARIAVGNDAHAELTVADRPRVTWHVPGKAATSVVPRALKQAHGADVAAVKETAEEIGKMLAAQRARLDLLFRRPVTWPYALWRQRYLDHGLVGALARRLIWLLDGAAAFHGADGWQDVTGRSVNARNETVVALWHPASRPSDEVLAWRQRLETLGVTQPIKQAYREVYLLTEAERRTRTYSNRFAAHIVRNHTVLAVSQARKWKMGMYGGESSPSVALPHFRVRAEWWVEPVGDDHDRMGFPLYLASDQVRFYRDGETEPMPLEDVPPLALTEVMRDVDLFVGVASVGNDPTWNDGGPDARYRDYWQRFSFGELTETAKTRKLALERLVPRLKIADRCALDDKFLVVRGDVRTYKIHLGSGNILMAPNDQYLCIVPERGTRDGPETGGLLLPFEGDSTLSVILSKAFLLAEDRNITDPTITRQLGGR